ncbi:hypothetical protein SKAU_G00171220 [Synaphobranchus kaupii]|uniref:Uncharacterized protein n=1 Tax=Synaphobranchus kaupii TaxID=118154 RepID=A0A9Q1FKX3_SYNKA|nr:hypothetical protein SKAU_G00171220 [Synaphobranchus kaupii]
MIASSVRQENIPDSRSLNWRVLQTNQVSDVSLLSQKAPLSPLSPPDRCHASRIRWTKGSRCFVWLSETPVSFKTTA